jgi:hypothetical protein
MRIKMLGAALTGALMLGATLAGAASAASVPPKSFFIDPITGEPDVVIAVGATANASDVVSGSLIAAAVGNMATVEETKTVTKSASNTFDYLIDYNYTFNDRSKSNDGLNKESYTGRCSGYNASWTTDYELYSYQFWETAYDGFPSSTYDLSVALAMPREIRNPNGDIVAKNLDTLWYSVTPKEWDSKDRVYMRSLSQISGGSSRVYYLVNNKTQCSDTDSPTYSTIFHKETSTELAKFPNDGFGPALTYAGGSYDNGDTTWDFDTFAFMDTGHG